MAGEATVGPNVCHGRSGLCRCQALIDLRWLQEEGAMDRQATGEAVSRVLADLAASRKMQPLEDLDESSGAFYMGLQSALEEYNRSCLELIGGGLAVSLLTIPEYVFSTESDVEQKFIMPLLTHPSFLESRRRPS